MAILSKGTDFTTGDQVTAAKLDALVDNATFASGAVDDSTTALDGDGKIIVKDGGITSAKLNLTANVGINTSSPEATLHVKDIGSTQPCILVQNASSSEGDLAVIDGDALQMGHWSGSSFTQRMSINSDGHVVVGRLQASSGSEDNGIVLKSDGEIYLARDGTSSQNHLLFINNAAVTATTVGSVSTSGSATSFNTSSDYRLKEDIVEMQDSISRVQALKPVNFAWKLDGTRVDGFLAHEAQEVVPAAVTGTKDAVDEDGQPDYQGIDQSKIVPLLTKALQEALTKIESLEARVAALES